jgi:hypothetical protein
MAAYLIRWAAQTRPANEWPRRLPPTPSPRGYPHRRRTNIRRMADVHTEAARALVWLIEAEGRIVTDSERAQAAKLVAAVEVWDLDWATTLLQALFCLADQPFRQAAWAVVEALMAEMGER